MKFVITLLVFLGLSVNLNFVYAASSGGDTGSSLYKSGKKLIIKAKKLEELLKVSYFYFKEDLYKFFHFIQRI